MIALSLGGISFAQTSELDRFDLMHFQTSAGKREPVTNDDMWNKRRAAIVTAMTTVMGPVRSDDHRVDLKIEVVDQASVGSYVRQLITFQSEPNSRTPAYLCIPKDVLRGDRKAAGVLCLHSTDAKVGHRVVVGLGGRAGRQYAAELAERGFVTISPAYPQLANYWPNLPELNYASGTMKAVWDNSRCLDLLQSLSYVDATHGFGAIGHSLGGHNAIYSAVFDDRLSVVVTSCGFDSYRDYKGGNERVWFYEKGWCGSRYMPRMSNYRGRLHEIPFDFPELLGALAPRPVFINAPLHDSNFRWESVDRCVEAAQHVYALKHASDAIELRHPDCDHNFPVEIRNASYRFIGFALKQSVVAPEER